MKPERPAKLKLSAGAEIRHAGDASQIFLAWKRGEIELRDDVLRLVHALQKIHNVNPKGIPGKIAKQALANFDKRHDK